MTKTILGENTIIEGKLNIPDRYNVYKNSKFGKTSKNHSFTSEGAFEQVLVFILKSGYLQEEDKSSLLGVHVLFDHLNKMMEWSKKIDFLDVRKAYKNWANQSEIDPNRRKQLLAALFHYDLDVPTLIRFLGGNYTGEYRDVKSTIKILRDSKCDPKIVSDLENILTIGCPNKFIASSSRKNFMDFFRYGNHTSIEKNVEQTMKAMNKEDRNQFLIPLPCWLARFLKHLHITPQGLLVKKDKNDRMIWDGTFIPHWLATCINMMLSHESEP